MWWILAPLGCAPEVEPPAARVAVPPLATEGPVWTATVLDVAAEPPPRFSAMFATPPSLAASTEPDRYPPVGKVQDGLCAGEGRWREQVVAAIRAAPEPERWRFWEVLTQPACRSEDWCGWLAREAAALPGEGGSPFWIGLRTCADPGTAAIVEQHAPDGAYLDWVLAHPGPFRPRVAEIATRRVRDPEALEPALAALQRADGAEAERALLALHRAAPAHVQPLVGAYLGDRESADARRIHRRACAGGASPACQWRRLDPLRAIEQGMVLYVDVDELLARRPDQRAALADALGRCTLEQAEAAPDVAASCGIALARLDRAAAGRAIDALRPIDGPLYELRTALAVGDARQLAEHLERIGFPPLSLPEGSRAVTAAEVLLDAGRAVPIDDGGSWPPRHDRLLYRLGRASGLAGVEFDELLPSDTAPVVAGRTPRTALFAWVDGRRLRTLAEEGDLGWDVARAVGLVNAVLAKRGAPDRVAVVASWDLAIVGPPAALEALAEASLVTFATPPPSWDEPMWVEDTDLPVE